MAILNLEWTSQSADVKVTIEGGPMEYSNDGGSIWQQLNPGVDIILAPGVGPYILKEQMACTVTRCGFTDHDCSANLTGDMTASGGTLTNANQMFFNCSGLNALDVSALNTSEVTSAISMFYNFKGTSLDVSNFDTRKCTTMQTMFNECTNLTTLDVSSFNTTLVTTMLGMFSGCASLISLDLIAFNTENVLSMSSMFADCTSLTEVDVSRFNTSGVTIMVQMFSGCRSLIGIDISSFDTNQTTAMTGMFANCVSLECLSNLNTIGAINGRGGIFVNCISLQRPEAIFQSALQTPTTGVGGSNWVSGIACPPPVDPLVIKWMSQSSDTRVTIENADMYYSNDGGATYSTLTPGTQPLPVGFGPYSLIEVVKGSVSRCAFDDASCSSNFEGSMEVYGGALTSMEGMFFECKGLTTLDVTNLNTEWVRNMKDAFSGLSGLTQLNTSNFNTESVEDMSGMFNGCSGLISIDVSSFNTSIVNDMSSMFAGCNEMTALDVTGFDTTAVIDMSYMFWACFKLLSIDLSSFDASLVLNTTQMFSQCCTLAYLDLSSFNTSGVANMKAMFWKSSSLVCITNIDSTGAFAPGGRDNMFTDCDALVRPEPGKQDIIMGAGGANWINPDPCPQP